MQVVKPLHTPDLDLEIEHVGIQRYSEIQALNEAVFGEPKVIYRLDRTDLTMLIARLDGKPVGYKVGYGEDTKTFYSAKGGVLESWRRKGIATALLHSLMEEARAMGYRRFAFDTFPNMHPGMTIMAINHGFKVKAAGYNPTYRDYRIRFEHRL